MSLGLILLIILVVALLGGFSGVGGGYGYGYGHGSVGILGVLLIVVIVLLVLGRICRGTTPNPKAGRNVETEHADAGDRGACGVSRPRRSARAPHRACAAGAWP